MQAYVFLKPHAVTGKAKALVADKFKAAGISIYKEGSLDAARIEQDKLIDNHYYAIANKASLSKPAELNPPAAKQDDFAKKFGLTWKAALEKARRHSGLERDPRKKDPALPDPPSARIPAAAADGACPRAACRQGIVFNAVDGCKRLGIDGAQMDAAWAKAKKEGKLVKFGGGFYAGKVANPGGGGGGGNQVDNKAWLTTLALTVYSLVGK